MVFGEEAVCPNWQTSELAVRNDEVIHNIHGWWLRDMNLSAKGSCPSAGCGMSCAEGWQLPLDVMALLCGAGSFILERRVQPARSQAVQQSSPPH